MEVILDIEGDNLLPHINNIWVAVLKPIGYEPQIFFNESDLKDWITRVKPTKVIGHNILGFDLPALHRVWSIPYLVNFLGEDDWFGQRTKFVDTLQLSQFLWADRPWGHSLEDWGNKLGYPKAKFSDWSKLTDEMVEYCVRDTEVTERVYKELLKEVEERYDE